MYPRLLAAPRRSFFLFGPRATGKSTWLRANFPTAHAFDLLRADVRVPLLRDPALFRRQVEAFDDREWVVVDEVQQVPALLPEIHSLIESTRRRFAMSGSSARKLVRGKANLLAGRASVRHMHPLSAVELGDDFVPSRVLRYGTLPIVVAAGREAADVLESYSLTYLKEEIQAEAFVRDLGAFARFLECSALANAQITNVSSLARDAGVQRTTVQGYFQILLDTLVGTLLPAYRPRARIKEQAHPKFYWFDSGVARAIAGRHRTEPTAEELGALLETYVLHELRTRMDVASLPGELSYWRTPDGVEVDFVLREAHRTVGIEVKAARDWRSSHGRGLRALASALPITGAWAVYLGASPQRDGSVRVLPVESFVRLLHAGEVIG
ncbi:MAG: ATP-binding protein [Deltaproteobacteria bacterium]|nr:ATP-binding protein [Deltaproteobacteria bacterium]